MTFDVLLIELNVLIVWWKRRWFLLTENFYPRPRTPAKNVVCSRFWAWKREIESTNVGLVIHARLTRSISDLRCKIPRTCVKSGQSLCIKIRMKHWPGRVCKMFDGFYRKWAHAITVIARQRKSAFYTSQHNHLSQTARHATQHMQMRLWYLCSKVTRTYVLQSDVRA